MKLPLFRVPLLVTLCALLLVPEASAAKPAKVKMRNAEGQGAAETTEAKTAKREEKINAKAGLENISEAESRQLARLRERLDVKDDAEWAVIAERIAKVEELRRGVALGAGGPRGVAAAGDKLRRNARGGASGGSELEALRAAVGDNYPESEIKARLHRAHEAHQQREAQLAKAQADLRALLSIRQEAVIVMMGLLPP